MAYPAYAEYTSTRWDEIGNIPSEWEARRLKFAVLLRNEKIEAESANLEYMGLENIQSWTGKRIEDESSFSEGIATRFEPNDILFGKLRPYLAKVYLAEKEGMATTEALVLQSERDLIPAFLKYLMLSDKFIDDVSGTTYGAKMPRANWELIGSLPILLPDLTEQQKIADFLDWKTGQIDALIAKKKQLIEKLKEKRIALITHAVTKGLNPNAKMKDSGIPWLGEVPEHWEVRRLKMSARLTDKKVEADEENSMSYIGMENIESWTGKLLALDADFVPLGVAIRFSNRSTLFGKLRPYLAKACNPNFDGLCSSEFLVIDSDDFDKRALLYWLLTEGFIDLVNSSTYGSKMPRANWDFIGNCLLPVPPIIEQQAIVDFLDRETDKLDALITKNQQLIEKLTEYRTALITAATTGKINVRGVKIGGNG